MLRFGTRPSIPIGTYGAGFLRGTLSLRLEEARAHWHVPGLTGQGKSRFLASLCLLFLDRGLSATLIDPAGDLAKLVLAYLVANGTYEDLTAYDRILYLDLPAAERQQRFLPFNVLRQRWSPYAIASNTKEAFHRAWPALAGGAAPMFDTLVQDAVHTLVVNGLPLASLYRYLTDREWREELLKKETDPDILAFWHDQFDRLGTREQTDQAGAALRRAHLLTFNPVLKYSLGQPENVLNFRDILDHNKSVIVDLALEDYEARRLLGCLLTVSAEQGALSRADLPPEQRHTTHYLMLDEFSEFTAQSEEALSRILSLTRKYGLFLIMAHQTWSQASQRLQGALQNVGITVAFKLGRDDAQYEAAILGRVDPLKVKHEVQDPHASERTHPTFYSLAEQWEEWVQALQNLKRQEALIRRPTGQVAKIRTLSVPDPKVDPQKLSEVASEYLRRYFRPRAEIEKELARYRTPQPTPTPRMEPLDAKE
jgi:hypothetical protein